MKPRLLDLFCGAGGAGAGYARAGFEVVGVDIIPQPRYPFEFYQADALEVLAGTSPIPTMDFVAIHASPPCQSFSKAVKKKNRGNHPDLVAETRFLLQETALPYVIENVPGAPLENPIQLCGSSFGLKVQRHRLFECSFPLMAPPCCHGINPRQYPPAWNRTTPLRVLSISGGYQTRKTMGDEDFLEQHKAAMGVDWEISYNELSNAIPPAYTQYIGEQLLRMLAADRPGATGTTTGASDGALRHDGLLSTGADSVRIGTDISAETEREILSTGSPRPVSAERDGAKGGDLGVGDTPKDNGPSLGQGSPGSGSSDSTPLTPSVDRRSGDA